MKRLINHRPINVECGQIKPGVSRTPKPSRRMGFEDWFRGDLWGRGRGPIGFCAGEKPSKWVFRNYSQDVDNCFPGQVEKTFVYHLSR